MTSTGPRTESGKAASSRNATKTGLFTTRDYILPHENDEYNQILVALFTHLNPQGILEQIHAAEIMTATWRLRRCGLVEAALATTDLSPDDLAKQQKSVDRARAQAHNLLRRSTAELRKLQTEAAIRAELGARGFDIQNFPGLTDSRQLLNTIHTWEKRSQANQPGSFCKPALRTQPAIPRNAPCPCGSNQKYKRCCGTDAPPVLNTPALKKAA